MLSRRLTRPAFALAATLALLLPLALGAAPAAADEADQAMTVQLDPSQLGAPSSEGGTGAGGALDLSLMTGDPEAPVSLIVRLSGPPVWDIYQAARDRIGAQGTDAEVLPPQTLATLNAALEARQEPAATAIEALGAQVISRYQVVLNGLLVHGTRAQIPAILQVPGVVSVSRAPSVSVALDKSVPWIGAKRVHDEPALGFDGTGTIVAVIDTGVDYTHAAFGGAGTNEAFLAVDPSFAEEGVFPSAKVVGGVDLAGAYYAANCPAQPVAGFTCNPVPEADDNPIDQMYPDGAVGQGHGSHVAGIVASQGSQTPEGQMAVPGGVAPGAHLVAVRIFGTPRGNPAFQNSTDLVADGLEWVVEHNLGMEVLGHAAQDAEGNRLPINVINMSVGGPWGAGMAEYNDVIGRVVDAGVTMVASAGNNGNVPYITGAPAAAAMAISVASSYADGEQGVRFDAAWDAGSLTATAFTAAETLAPPFTGLPPYADLPMAYYGKACNATSANEPAQDVNEKVALIERGDCNFSEKFANAAAKGAIAVVIYSNANPPGAMGGSCWPNATCVDIPGIMISQADGQRLQGLLVGQQKEVRATFTSIPRPELTNTISSFSSRGPARFTGGVKPQITAPGSSISSVWSGTGYASISQDGTSMSGPTVAGVAALLWQRNLDQGLGLDAAGVGALTMNYAEQVIHVEANNAGPLVPVSRQGGGLVNAYNSAVGDTVVRSAEGVAELGFANVHADETTAVEQTLTVHNLSDAAKTYRPSAALVQADDAGKGSSLSFEPATLTIPAGGEAELTVTLTVDPATARPWTIPGPARNQSMQSTPNFDTFEYDGAVHLTEVDAGGQAVAGGDVVRIPFSSLPQRRSCVTGPSAPITLSGDTVVDQVSTNACPQAGGVAPYLVGGQDPVEEGYPGKVNIDTIGLRWYGTGAVDPAHPGLALQVLELAIQTEGARRFPLDVTLRVLFDTDSDGSVDRIGFNFFDQAQRMWITLMADPIPGSLEPNFATAVRPDGSAYVNIQPYDLAETTSVLRFFINHPEFGLGKDMSTGDVSFRFAVSAGDQTEDYPVTDAFLGYDLAPDNLEALLEPGIQDDETYAWSQAEHDCVALTRADNGEPVTGLPELLAVNGGGGQAGFRVRAACEPDRDLDFALMLHYPYNAAGSQVQIRPGHIEASGAKVYLPFAVLNHPEPTPTPTAEPGGDITMSGRVFDAAQPEQAIAGARVAISTCTPHQPFQGTSDAEGRYSVLLPASYANACQEVTLEVTAAGYADWRGTVPVAELRATPERNFGLQAQAPTPMP